MRYDNHDFVVQEGRLKFFRAAKTVIVVETPLACHQLCQIMFARDGSIFLDFPFFQRGPGIVSRVELSPEANGPLTIDLKENGRLSTHQVKFSHHPTGEALFSKTGKVRTEIRRQSFPLNGPIGHLFQIHAYWLSGFELLSEERLKRKKLYLPFGIEAKIPAGIVLSAQWRRKAAILSNIEPASARSTVGPAPKALHRPTGKRTQLFLLGQPDSSPLRDHLIVIECDEAPPPSGVEAPTMILMGGWDPHEVQEPGLKPSTPATGFLTFMYPAGRPEELKRLIGSLDMVQ